MSLTVRDGRVRRLLVVGFRDYGENSGLAPLRGVDEEIGTVRTVFRELGYPDERHRVWMPSVRKEDDSDRDKRPGTAFGHHRAFSLGSRLGRSRTANGHR